MNPLHNYQQFRDRVDALCTDIVTQLGGHITCGPGCDSCCRALSLFPVEAFVLRQAFSGLPAKKVDQVRQRMKQQSPGFCPFLNDGLCLVYEARPIICRTHGLPILLEEEGSRRVDFCPKNFVGLESLPGSAIIQLDQLNTTLAAINQAFVLEVYGSEPVPARVNMAEIISGKWYV